MRGSLSFMQTCTEPKNFFGLRKTATVKVKGSEDLKLVQQGYSLQFRKTYTLFDQQNNIIKSWYLNPQTSFFGAYSVSFTLSEDPKIIYQSSNHIPLFITNDGETMAVYEISGSNKKFNLLDIEIHHKDYESEICFRAPDDQIYLAIIVTQFLYNPPFHPEPS